MTNEELTRAIHSLGEMNLALAGRLAALEAANGALLAALGSSLPPLLPQIEQHLFGLAPHARASLEPESFEAFENAVASFAANVRALQG